MLHSLDALRGIAALGVVVYHFHQYFAPVSAAGGYLAVDLFFMLSGVVITRAYGKRFAAGMTTGEFMLIRLIRLYPLYALGTALGLAAAVASLHGNNLDHWQGSTLSIAALLAVFMIPNFTGHPNERLFPLNAPCWSLFLEILVNLLFGALWTRPGLDPKIRALICVISDTATGRDPELKLHLRMARNEGWTEDELVESLLHLLGYVGAPLVREALLVAKETFAEMRAET